MKFTDGFWQMRPGVTPIHAQEAYDIEADEGERLLVTAPSTVINRRGDTLNRPVLSLTLSSPLRGVIGVRVEHHTGGLDPFGFDLVGAVEGAGEAQIDDQGRGVLDAGPLRAVIEPGAPFSLRFEAEGRVLTSAAAKSAAHLLIADDAQVDGAPVGTARDGSARALAPSYTLQQLSLGVGELVYGLGERFGPLVKNGQTVDVWNADGGTSSEQAYKNVPFYLTNRGYGVLVDHPGHVSFEIGSESVERVQFSVAGESLQYYIVQGSTPAEILDRYTQLTGRPAQVPAWSYGLWLSTSFTTSYDEATVTSFIEGMAERDLPVSVFHFDCFWMREFNWCDFEWDPRVFPDPEGMLARLHDRDLRVCVWINPYIGQRSPLFAEAQDAGYLVRRPDGSVWQWDLWQAGMALVDFTNPAATAWFQDKLRALQRQGVDAFKTDFGERIPVDVEYFDGSSPERMHNYYTQLYNLAVFEVLEEERGKGDAVLFARSATVGGQRLPVHWGGDCTSTFESMAETLRGGLSLAFSGFGFWSHDIGGFEGTPDAAVFKRWTAFGLLSSHSRLHGSTSYRVPWEFDGALAEGEASAVDVTRTFTELKLSLMPYLYTAGLEATRRGTPVMRPMALAFPEDRGAAYVDTQYMLGPDLLVAPVLSVDGDVDVYLPEGVWTDYFTGRVVQGGGWRREKHGFLTLPLYVRAGAVLPIGARVDRPDYDYLDGVTLRVFPGATGQDRVVIVETPEGRRARFVVSDSDEGPAVLAEGVEGWTVEVVPA
ncbi:alpha-xylosidase [Rathayibacter sp. SD072]|uniref:alpha-xylosidase n=1 Tax=Rathayibacter sp. SD072 TaxID=2781731 RepID=UPI001A976648|nr:alpha-xylosidase [Rathayibacter sp. SD072]MBO0984571.1 alpha-xylosidase [Rathayibacter sp. SD072]